MKKFNKLLMIISLAFGGFFLSPSNDVEAAWSEWQSVPKAGVNCQVRVQTDAYNYYSTADTVDIKAESNGACGKLYYMLHLPYNFANFMMVTDEQVGYFTYATPVKYFDINHIDEEVGSRATLDLFSSSNYSEETYLGTVYGHKFTIWPQ
ncbi:hypothetical protein WAK64_20635 [Bacillus spongiae]|uniref:DUF4879 domain-containing protein n=1 Tax=Bacillus spongiae TaxID=2683610 RepID=A0ABU8HK08_9BACI